MKKSNLVFFLILMFLSIISFTKEESPTQLLFKGVAEENPVLIKEALNKGASVKSKDVFNRTPLHLAAWKGNEEILKLLLRNYQIKGYAIHLDLHNLEDGYGWTPLHFAALGNTASHVSILKLLLELGADINAHKTDYAPNLADETFDAGVSPLHVAAKMGNVVMVEALLAQKDINPDIKDGYGLTPLHYAVISKNNQAYSVAQLLIRNHAQVNARTIKKRHSYLKGSTPLKVGIYYLADTMMMQLSHYVIEQTLNYLKPTLMSGVRISLMLQQYFTKKVGFDNKYFLKLLREEIGKQEEFVMVYVADNNGNLIMAKRMPDKSISDRLVINKDGKINEVYVHANQSYKTQFPNKSEDADKGYDPRKRIWYQKAAAEKKMIWTDVYTFATDKKPGLSNATPIYDGEGKLQAISSIDVGVIELSYFLRTLEVGKRGKVFIMSHYQDEQKKSKVIALPIRNDFEIEQLFKKVKQGDSFQYQVADISEIEQRDIAESYSAFQYQYPGVGKQGTYPFAYLYKGEPYLGLYLSFPSNTGLNWMIGIIIPENEVLRSVEAHKKVIKAQEARLRIQNQFRLLQLLRKNGGKSLDINDDLFISVQTGNKVGLIEALQNGADVNARDQNGWRVLHYAVQNEGEKAVELLKILLEQKNINFLYKTEGSQNGVPAGTSVYGVAQLTHNQSILTFLENHRQEINQVMLTAIEKGDKDGMLNALRQGADVDARNKDQYTGLQLSIIQGKPELSEILIKRGANLKLTDQNGWNALHFAARFEYYSLAELMLSKGAPLNARTTKRVLNFVGGSTPLQIVMSFTDSPLVPLFRQRGGMAVDANDDLLKAAMEGNLKLAQGALKRGADINIDDREGWTPLHLAVWYQKRGIVEFLLTAGADPQAKIRRSRFGISQGTSALELAQKKGNERIIRAFKEVRR